MRCKVLFMWFTAAISAAPMQLKFHQHLNSFQKEPLEVPNVEMPQEIMEIPESKMMHEPLEPLYWSPPPIPSPEMLYQKSLLQDQVQHQTFTPQHVIMNPATVQPNPYMQLAPQMPMPMLNQVAMEQQILALQRLQALQNFNAASMSLLSPRPLLILLPMQALKDTKERYTSKNSDKKQSDTNAEHKTDYPYENTDPESVIVDAANSEYEDTERPKSPQRAILLFPNPNSRFSLGEIISGIPWLPFEVNVPDTISWAYNGISNGISGIISVIGQWPFSRPSTRSQLQDSIEKMYLKENMMNTVEIMPVLMMLPMNAQIAQLPMVR